MGTPLCVLGRCCRLAARTAAAQAEEYRRRSACTFLNVGHLQVCLAAVRDRTLDATRRPPSASETQATSRRKHPSRFRPSAIAARPSTNPPSPKRSPPRQKVLTRYHIVEKTAAPTAAPPIIQAV